MRAWFLLRLFLDFLAVSFMLTAYAYNWLGNAAHEIIGTAMFLLLIAHNGFNRRWWGAIAREWCQPRPMLTKAITLSLLAVMGVLLITSVIISQTVFSFLPLKTTFATRQLHTLAAYVSLLVASGHLGLSWSMIMSVACTRLGLVPSRFRTVLLRALTLVVAAYGISSLAALNVGAKLRMEVPMGFADFKDPAPEFLAQHVAMVVLCAAAILSLEIASVQKETLMSCRPPRPQKGRASASLVPAVQCCLRFASFKYFHLKEVNYRFCSISPR